MPVYKLLRGVHRENGVTYVANGIGRPSGKSGREYGGDLIETEKNLLVHNTASDGHPSAQPKFELVTP